MVNIVVDNKIPFIKGVLEPYANVSYLPVKEITRQRLMAVDALVVRTRTHCSAELLDGTAVKFIASATIGYDHIDVDYCSSKNIFWTNAAGCNSSSVEQYVLAALLELAQRNNFKLTSKTIGIVGVGNVGSKIAGMAEVLGMKVVLCDPPRARKEGAAGFVSLEELASIADIISIHVSLSREGIDETYGLFNSSFFSKVKPSVIFVNASRGEVVDELSLKNAIRSNMLYEVVLDVWCNEPKIDRELLDMVSIATPHIAGYSVDGKAKGTAMSVNAISRFFGWDLNAWFPESLPLPENTRLSVDFPIGTFEQNLHRLIKMTYDIMSDDERLRLSPDEFEQQRGCYPLRREFDSYIVETLNITDKDKQKLSRLRFRLT